MNKSAEARTPETESSPVERAFRLLHFIADGGSTANVSEISRQINVNRITVMRLLDTLETAGLITPVHVNGVPAAHQLGMRFLTLAASALGSYDLTARARQVMPALVAATGLSAYLVVRDGTEVVYLLRETPDTPLVSRVKVGSRLPAHTATSGLVLLAQLDPVALRALYKDVFSLDANPHQAGNRTSLNTDLRSELYPKDFDVLQATLATVREQGCAWSFSGLEAGINSCAAAVIDQHGHAIAALSLAGPSGQFGGSEIERQDQCSKIEKALQFSVAELSRSQG